MMHKAVRDKSDDSQVVDKDTGYQHVHETDMKAEAATEDRAQEATYTGKDRSYEQNSLAYDASGSHQ